MEAIRFTAGVESISAHEERVISTVAPGRMSCHASVDSERSAGKMIVAGISQRGKRYCLRIASCRAATPLVAGSGSMRNGGTERFRAFFMESSHPTGLSVWGGTEPMRTKRGSGRPAA